MAQQIVFLKYSFLFDAVETWQHLSQFEDSLADFFTAHGFQARIIKSIEGQFGERIMLIEKIPDLKPEHIPLKIQEPSETLLEEMRRQMKPDLKVTKIKRGTESKLKVKQKERVKLTFKKGRNYKKVEIEPKLGGRR